MKEEKVRLVFVTNNSHKLEEIRKIAGDKIEILSLADINCSDEIPETADTIRENALMKAHYVAEKYGVDCFADDTGLEVEALNGAPGVHTARYASVNGHDTLANMQLLLQNLKGVTNRKACFVTVIALIKDDKEMTFEGICPGIIREEMHGDAGFGYDPVFQPDGFDMTFAEMGTEEKNKISHRGKATCLLMDYLLDDNSL